MEPPQRSNTAWPFSGVIAAGAWQRVPTARLWESIRAAAARYHLPLPTFRDVNAMRAFQTGIRRTNEQARKAPSSETDLTRFITPVARSRQPDVRAAVPRFALRYEVSQRVGDIEGTHWYTSPLGRFLPASVGEIRQQVAELAELGAEGSPPEQSTPTGNWFIAEL